MRTLRSYQAEAVAAVRDVWGRGTTRVAGVAATGLGKTDILAALIAEEVASGGRATVLAHRDFLLDQLTARIGMYAPQVPVGRVQAGRNETRYPITVASVQTAMQPKRLALLERPTLIVLDECHHAAAPSNMTVLSALGAFDHVRTLGVTATLVREDKRSLGDVWEEVAFNRDIRWGVDEGYLVRPRGRAVVLEHMDLSKAKVTRGDYQDRELGEMVTQDVDQIVDAWVKQAENRITAAFVPTVAASEALAEEFRRRGVPTVEIYGTSSPTERKAAYDALVSGAARVLCGVMVASEGWDCPPVSCILMARPTRSQGLYCQIIGRGLRTLDPREFPGHPVKTDCLVLDAVGATRYQNLCTLPDLMPAVEYDRIELDALPEPVGPGRRKDENRLLGPAEYEDVDLFATSEAGWLFTRGGKRFLHAGKEHVVLIWPNADGTWRSGVCTSRGKVVGEWFIRSTASLREARDAAERFAFDVDPSLARRDAAWRRKKSSPPSGKQLIEAGAAGVANPEQYNRARLSDEISIAKMSDRFDR